MWEKKLKSLNDIVYFHKLTDTDIGHQINIKLLTTLNTWLLFIDS